MDILPAGPKLRAAGQLTWPKSGMVMSLAGFDYVFPQAVEIEMTPGPRVHVRSDSPEVAFEVVLKTGEPDFGWALFGVEGLNRIGR